MVRNYFSLFLILPLLLCVTSIIAQGLICPAPSPACSSFIVNQLNTSYPFANTTFAGDVAQDAGQFNFINLGMMTQNFTFINVGFSLSYACSANLSQVITQTFTAGNFSFLNVAPGVLMSSFAAIGGEATFSTNAGGIGPSFGTCNNGSFMLVGPAVFNFAVASTVPGTSVLVNNTVVTIAPGAVLNATSGNIIIKTNDLACFPCTFTPLFDISLSSPYPANTTILNNGSLCFNYSVTNLANSTQDLMLGNILVDFQSLCSYNTSTSVSNAILGPKQNFTLASGATGQSGILCASNPVAGVCVNSTYLLLASSFRFSTIVTANMTQVPIALSFRLGVNPGNQPLIFGNDSQVVNTTSSNPNCPAAPLGSVWSKWRIIPNAANMAEKFVMQREENILLV